MKNDRKELFETIVEDCPKCNREAVIIVTSYQKTLKCLNCGFYKSGPVEFFMNISDVNALRRTLNLKLLKILIKVKKFFLNNLEMLYRYCDC